jgi:hypothetical protein
MSKQSASLTVSADHAGGAGAIQDRHTRAELPAQTAYSLFDMASKRARSITRMA